MLNQIPQNKKTLQILPGSDLKKLTLFTLNKVFLMSTKGQIHSVGLFQFYTVKFIKFPKL